MYFGDPIKKIILKAAAVLLSTSIALTALVSYDISWTGPNDYSLTGSFSFDDATAGSAIDQTELTTFSIDGFLRGSSLGTYSGPVANFNFDATTGQFLVGGLTSSTSRQIWNYNGTGIGFVSGNAGQLLYLNGSGIYPGSFIDVAENTLSASLSQPVISNAPLPAALPLFGAAMGLLGFLGWRRKAGTLKAA